MGIADISIAAVAAVFSSVAAFASWKTASEANRTATAVAQIERDRWHKEMTPTVGLAVTNERGRPELLVEFNGPAPLGAINELELSIRDDRDRSDDRTLAGGATPEERARTIWGPFRLSPHIDGADALGRSAGTFSLTHGEQRRFAIEASKPPRWYEGAEGARRWQGEYQHTPLRVWVVCRVDGHKSWKLTADLITNGMTPEWVQAH
ncbi:hypothetical protein [Streptomyces brevispora]|uniref:hypothetical protein n=1 Tax=Streptomyces brevispora TaxID=887462 RepID=UPI00381112EE